MEYTKYLVQQIQQKVKFAKKKGVILGISGGVDSAVLASLAKQAFPNHSLAIFMPIQTCEQDFVDVNKIVDKLQINNQTFDLTLEWQNLKKILKLEKHLSTINLKARLRMATLYALAQEHNYLVLGSSNVFEWILGYFTKFGDGVADLHPLINLTKKQIFSLVTKLNLPKFLKTKLPSAGLYPGQTDEKELGFSYQILDKWFNNKKISQQFLNKINHKIKTSEHKRTNYKLLKPNHKKFSKL